MILFYFFCFFLASLSAEEEALVINSGEVQYHDNEIVLVGQVAIQHHLGQISAHRLSIRSSNKKNKFSFFQMSQDVQIKLCEGGELYCQQAEIDYVNMQGTLLGSPELPDVTYLNQEEKKGGEIKPLEVKSRQMTFEMMRDSKTSKMLVNQIEAWQDIRVLYNQDYLLLADRACYQRISEDASFKGLLTLSVDHHQCRMTNLNHDCLFAKTIQINTVDGVLRLEEPVGTLYMRQHPVQVLEFAADELIWTDCKLQLRGRVNMTQNQAVCMQTDKELMITMKDGDLSLIQAPQDVHISYFVKGNSHKIYCPGPFLIDHECQCMVLHGLFNSLTNSQVYIESILGEMYADEIRMNYSLQDKELIPDKMTLKGHVRLLNRFDGHLEESSSILHDAMADLVECFPKDQEMILSSYSKGRVLFFDKVNKIQMSAPSLKIKHDASTGKNSIQGLGDVRFTFIEKELEQFKKSRYGEK